MNDFHRRLDGLVVSRHFVSPAPVVGNDVRERAAYGGGTSHDYFFYVFVVLFLGFSLR